MAEENVEISALANFEKLLKNCSKNALISLKVFSAGTVTNSYSEIVNNVLRKAGANHSHRMLTVLRYLDNFSVEHNIPKKHQFSPSDKLLSVIGNDIIDTVTDGCLCRFQTKVRKSIEHCQVLERHGDHAVVQEKTSKVVRFKFRTHNHGQLGRCRWKRVLKRVRWNVDREGKRI